MEKKFNYVYLTTNLINGKQYIGDHSTNNESFDEYYLGSGRPYFQNALNEYGKENFKKEILEFFSSKEEAFNAQEKYIIQYNTLVPNGYNISPTGGLHNKGIHSEESKRKIGEANKISLKGKKRSIKSREKQSLTNMKHTVSYETRKKIGEANKISLKGKKQTSSHIENSAIHRRGKPRSEETKRKISESEKGKTVTLETRKKQSESHKGQIPWNKGKKKQF